MHCIFYEDLKKDLGGGLEKLAKLLGKEFSKEPLERLNEHLKFEKERNDESGQKIHTKYNMMPII